MLTITPGFGSFIAIFICNFGLDRIYIKLRGPDAANGKPEHRLPLTIIGAFTLPLSIVGYGLVAQYHLPVALLLLCVDCSASRFYSQSFH